VFSTAADAVRRSAPVPIVDTALRRFLAGLGDPVRSTYMSVLEEGAAVIMGLDLAAISALGLVVKYGLLYLKIG